MFFAAGFKARQLCLAASGHALQVQRPDGKRELYPLFFERFINPQIDRLLCIHIVVVIGAQNVVNDFELQRELTVSLKVGAIETHVGLGLDGIA